MSRKQVEVRGRVVRWSEGVIDTTNIWQAWAATSRIVSVAVGSEVYHLRTKSTIERNRLMRAIAYAMSGRDTQSTACSEPAT